MKKVLVLGGTQFIGRHVVERLIQDHHDVTLLNRAKTAPELFPHVSLIKADRESDNLKSIKELQQSWDAVIDLCAYYPKSVFNLLESLKGYAGRYILCSTVSAYVATSMDGPTSIIDEESPLRECTEQEALDTSMARDLLCRRQ